jgi:histidinol-phosphate aminotransferase
MPLVTRDTFLTLCTKHVLTGSNCTVLTTDVDDPTGYGRVLRDEEGGYLGIVEHRDCTPEQLKIREINAGIYIFDASMLFEALLEINNNNDQHEYYLTDAPGIIMGHGGRVCIYKCPEPEQLLGVNNPDQLAVVEDTVFRRRAAKYFNATTRAITPYTAGEQPPAGSKLIKLNTNENPYPPSPKVAEAVAAAIPYLRLYPDTEATAAAEAFAEHYGVDRSQVFVSNGSDEALALCFLAFWDKDRPLVAPEFSYSFYPVYANLFGVPLKRVPMLPDWSIDVDALCREKGGVIFANPNAPTSKAMPLSDVERILKAHPNDVVLADDAYADFSDASALSLLPKYKNLVVVKTLSKSHSLAGLRIGFAVADKYLIEGINKVKNSFNSYTVDRLAIAGAAAALSDGDYTAECLRKVIATRERTAAALRRLGFDLPVSSSNFLFASHPSIQASELFAYLRKHGILVRYFNTPGIDNRLRISIGTDVEMDEVIRAISEYPDI